MSFQAYLDSIKAKQSPIQQDTNYSYSPGDGSIDNVTYSNPAYSIGQKLPELRNAYAFGKVGYTPQSISDRFVPGYVDQLGGFLGYDGDMQSGYAQYNSAGAQEERAQAAALAEQQRLAHAQQTQQLTDQRNASRQAGPQFQGSNLMGLLQYQPQQQQAPQQQAPQQGLLGGMHRPGFVASPGATNGQTGGGQ